jgi:hypothetical protein
MLRLFPFKVLNVLSRLYFEYVDFDVQRTFLLVLRFPLLKKIRLLLKFCSIVLTFFRILLCIDANQCLLVIEIFVKGIEVIFLFV